MTGKHWAAVLAVGSGAALCDLTGAALYGIRRWDGDIHVAAPSQRRDHRGVVVHRVESLTGAGRLRRALRHAVDDPGQGRTHQELEALVMTRMRRLPGLPPYGRNALVQLSGGRVAKADVLFTGLGVMLELDSRTWHEQRLAMDSDRRRDQQALAAGIVTFRITWRHATTEWDAVAADLMATLTTSRPSS